MPARAALNAYYAWCVRHLDAKERAEFDGALYGWTARNEAANEALLHGGEDS